MKRMARAFTLIEVMVALFVLALTFIGVIGTATHVARAVSTLEEKTVSLWVAQNAVSEISLGLWGEVNDSITLQEEKTMAGKHWYWTAKTVQENDLQRVSVSVSAEKNGEVLSKMDFLHYLAKEPVDEKK